MKSNLFSVLISVYCKENPLFLREYLSSIFNQTIWPTEVVLIKDGPLNRELDAVIDEFSFKYPIFKIIANDKNLGLGLSLALGIESCSNEYIARMDTDDNMPCDRFEKELKKINEGYDVVSCWSLLYDVDIQNPVAIKKRPASHKEILALAKKRSPICHAGCMYRRSMVLKAGNYQHCNLYEDYHLWARMFLSGARFFNIQEVLYYVRTSSEMIGRRGGWLYAFNEIRTFMYFYKIGFYTLMDLFRNVATHFPVRMMPLFLRSYAMRKLWNYK